MINSVTLSEVGWLWETVRAELSKLNVKYLAICWLSYQGSIPSISNGLSYLIHNERAGTFFKVQKSTGVTNALIS